MRVAVLSYPMLFQTAGGLRMKIHRTVEALNREGVDARLVDPVHERLTDYDLVHVFAPFNGNHRIIEQAKSDGLPVVLSTILNLPFSAWEGKRARFLDRVVGRLTNWEVTTSYRQVLTALTLADRLIVLGRQERLMLTDAYGIQPDKISIVYNGIGDEFFSSTPDTFLAAHPVPRPFVLHTGIIGDVKNQLGLVRALRNEPIDVVLIGYAGRASQDYLAECLQEGGSRVHYLGELPHGDMIASAYAACALVAIPSRHEGMPNSVLEALAADRPVVLTNNHTIDFDLPPDVALEVDPDDHRRIREAVTDLLARERKPGKAQAIVADLRWSAVARQLLQIYGSLTA